MIAMQYNFALPADYDMAIIDRRIAEKGSFTDNFPGLNFKAYLIARRGEDSAENLYAPFYVWRRDEGLSNFLCGPGFEGVSGAFGWPSVRTWIVWRSAVDRAIGEAAFASREILAIGPHADLGELRRRESEETAADVAAGALASVAAFEPTTWTRVRFRLWRERPRSTTAGMQIYRVGHMSLSGEGEGQDRAA
jgi:hypothetical protein